MVRGTRVLDLADPVSTIALSLWPPFDIRLPDDFCFVVEKSIVQLGQEDFYIGLRRARPATLMSSSPLFFSPNLPVSRPNGA